MGRRRGKARARAKRALIADLILGVVALVVAFLLTGSKPLGQFLDLIFNLALLVLIVWLAVRLFTGNKTSSDAYLSVRQEPQIRPTKPYSLSFQTLDEESAPNELEKEWSLDLITSLEWKRFEALCAGYFTAKGYRAEVSREGADGGVDIYLYKESYSTEKAFGIVQCKAWNTYKVGVKPVRELYGVMASEKAPLGVFINTGSYTNEAEEFVKGKRLKLLTGNDLLGLITTLPEEKQQRLLAKVTAGDYTTPSCPSCGIKMIERVSQRGKNKGNQFWGCSNYPSCRQTLQMKK